MSQSVAYVTIVPQPTIDLPDSHDVMAMVQDCLEQLDGLVNILELVDALDGAIQPERDALREGLIHALTRLTD